MLAGSDGNVQRKTKSGARFNFMLRNIREHGLRTHTFVRYRHGLLRILLECSFVDCLQVHSHPLANVHRSDRLNGT